MCKRIFIVVMLFYGMIVELSSQPFVAEIDSIWSNDILVQSCPDSLLKVYGPPDFVSNNTRTRVSFLTDSGEWFDSILIYNSISYLDKGLEYAEKDGLACLTSIRFFSNEKATLQTNKMDFNRKTKLKDVVRTYRIKPQNVIKERLRLFEEYPSPCYYSTVLSKGFSPRDVCLIFDCRKKLLGMFILPVY